MTTQTDTPRPTTMEGATPAGAPAASGRAPRRVVRYSSAPASSATAGVAQSKAVAAVKRGRSSTKSP